MLPIANLEELESLLLQVPALVDRQARRDLDTVPAIKAWLGRAEALLSRNRMPIAGSIAGLRSGILAAEQGIVLAPIEIDGRTSRRRRVEAAAVGALREANERVVDALAADRARVAEAAKMGRQLVALAYFKGLLEDLPNGEDLTGRLRAVWTRISEDPEARGGAAHLLGLVGYPDVLVVLDRVLTADLPPDEG